MKKYYDKILFLLGLAVLGIGAAFYYLKGGIPASAPLPPMKLSGAAFEPIPPPTIEDKTADWEAPPDQGEENNDPGWTYYVFTPPKIWWQDGEGWTSLQPSGTVTQRPFGIQLLSAGKDLYRIQLLGAGGNGDASDFILFSDEENPGYGDLRLRVGDESTRAQIKVVSMKVDSVEEPHGLTQRVTFVTILDERTGQNVDLRSDQLYSPTNSEYYKLRITAPYPEEEWTVMKVGDTKEIPNTNGVSFEVTALDFDTPSVTVSKHSKNRKGLELKPISRVLTIVDESAAPEPTQPTKSGRPPAKSYAAPAKPAAQGKDPFAP